jgi:hypothetical protein
MPAIRFLPSKGKYINPNPAKTSEKSDTFILTKSFNYDSIIPASHFSAAFHPVH